MWRICGFESPNQPFWALRVTALLFALAVPVLAQNDLNELYTQAQQAQASGDLPTAIAKYEAIVQLQPRMAEAYANLGNLYFQQGNTKRAKAAYLKAIEQKPELTGPHFLLGVIAFQDHDYSTALTHLEKAAATQTNNSQVYAYLGYTRFARSEFGDAASNLERAAALNGADIDVLYHLSKSYGHLADRAFAQLQTDFPNSVYRALARAHVAEIKEDWAGAAAQYRLALEKMPDNPRLREKARWSAARAAGNTTPLADPPTDEIIDASLAYKDAALSGPKLKQEIAAWQTKVNALASSNRDDRQLYLLGEGHQILAYLTSLDVLDIDPDSYRTHELRAQMFEQSNSDDRAIEEYREALKRKPDLQNIHFAIGSLYWKDEHLDDAWLELQAELKTNPHHPQALYESGDICLSKGHPAEAEKYFLEAVRLQPDMEEAHYALEKIYTESGRYDKSLEQLRAAIKANAADYTAHYRLFVVYRKLGRQEEAQRELAQFEKSKKGPPAQSGSSTVK
jgi:tetratricopeptide (TPR) repeat protein